MSECGCWRGLLSSFNFIFLSRLQTSTNDYQPANKTCLPDAGHLVRKALGGIKAHWGLKMSMAIWGTTTAMKTSPCWLPLTQTPSIDGSQCSAWEPRPGVDVRRKAWGPKETFDRKCFNWVDLITSMLFELLYILHVTNSQIFLRSTVALHLFSTFFATAN